MSTESFSALDDKLESKADNGVSATRKAHLAESSAPYHVLEAHGVDLPHHDYAPEDAIAFPNTVEHDGETVSLFQDVHEEVDNPLDDATIVWTVCSLEDGEALLKDTESWSRREWVPVEELLAEASNYEPQWLDENEPRWGY